MSNSHRRILIDFILKVKHACTAKQFLESPFKIIYVREIVEPIKTNLLYMSVLSTKKDNFLTLQLCLFDVGNMKATNNILVFITMTINVFCIAYIRLENNR